MLLLGSLDFSPVCWSMSPFSQEANGPARRGEKPKISGVTRGWFATDSFAYITLWNNLLVMTRNFQSQPIHLQIFDWESPGAFIKQIEEQWLLTGEDYVVLECLARQSIMRWTGNQFSYEPINTDLEIHKFKTCDAYLAAIMNFIKKVEVNKKKGFQRALDLTDARNDRRKDTLKFYEEFGRIENDPLVLIDRKNEDGSYSRPTVYLEYGSEKAIFDTIFNDLADAPKLEDDISQEAEEEKQSGGKGKIKHRHIKEFKKYFGKDGKERGRYLGAPLVEAQNIHFPVHPSEHYFFKEFIAAYHAIFHSYFELDNQNERHFRDNFDNFLAAKLKYMFGDDSVRLKKIGYDIDSLFVRKGIKDRIKGSPHNDTRKFQVFGSSNSDNLSLLNREFLEFLEKRNPIRRNMRTDYQD